MIEFQFNGESLQPESTEALGLLLDRFDESPTFELWAEAPSGACLCMLRNRDSAWLKYLPKDGDKGFSSRAPIERVGVAEFWLSNGQRDEYPLSWCIEVEQCYKAIAYFFENAGEKPEWIAWQES